MTGLVTEIPGLIQKRRKGRATFTQSSMYRNQLFFLFSLASKEERVFGLWRRSFTPPLPILIPGSYVNSWLRKYPIYFLMTNTKEADMAVELPKNKGPWLEKYCYRARENCGPPFNHTFLELEKCLKILLQKKEHKKCRNSGEKRQGRQQEVIKCEINFQKMTEKTIDPAPLKLKLIYKKTKTVQ